MPFRTAVKLREDLGKLCLHTVGITSDVLYAHFENTIGRRRDGRRLFISGINMGWMKIIDKFL